MDSEITFVLIVVLFFAVVVALIFGGFSWYSREVCAAQTTDIGFNHRWSVMGGCQIEVKPGQWIPLDSYYFKEE